MDRSRAHPAPPRNSGCPHERSIRKSSVSKSTNIGSRCQGPADPFPIEGKLKTHNWEFLVKPRASADASAGLEALVSTRLASG